MQDDHADIVVFNARIATQDMRRSFASAAAIKDGRFITVGNDSQALGYKGSKTGVIDVNGRTVVPGLSDTHTHFIRECLNYNMELEMG